MDFGAIVLIFFGCLIFVMVFGTFAVFIKSLSKGQNHQNNRQPSQNNRQPSQNNRQSTLQRIQSSKHQTQP